MQGRKGVKKRVPSPLDLKAWSPGIPPSPHIVAVRPSALEWPGSRPQELTTKHGFSQREADEIVEFLLPMLRYASAAVERNMGFSGMHHFLFFYIYIFFSHIIIIFFYIIYIFYAVVVFCLRYGEGSLSRICRREV